MELKNFDKKDVEVWIKVCQRENHVQQVAFSTYHHALTQLCFTCDCVRTSMNKKDYAQHRKDVEVKK